jgi:hypothetical protein
MTGSNRHNHSNHNNNYNYNNNNNKFLRFKQQQQQHFDSDDDNHTKHGSAKTTSYWANRRSTVNGNVTSPVISRNGNSISTSTSSNKSRRKATSKKAMVRVQMLLSVLIFLVFLNGPVLLHRSTDTDMDNTNAPNAPTRGTANTIQDILPNFAIASPSRMSSESKSLVTSLISKSTSTSNNENENKNENGTANNHTPYVSLVVVLMDRHKTTNVLASLLPSILQQQQQHQQHQGNSFHFEFEIVIADASCRVDSTLNRDMQRFLDDATLNPTRIQHTAIKIIEACEQHDSENTHDTQKDYSYAVLANRAVAKTATSSQFVLLLNEHIVLQNNTFVQSMVELLDAKPNAAAVGCKLLSDDGTTLIEGLGGIVWSDASTTSFGVDRTDLDAPDVMFPRPVDYVTSRACLMVNKTVFQNYNGFEDNNHQHHRQHNSNSNSNRQHYQELDLQMHIQHDLHMEVWVQPSAVATHADPASVGNRNSNNNSNNDSNSNNSNSNSNHSSNNKWLRHSNAKSFQEKWKEVLVHHPPTPSYHNVSSNTSSSNSSRHVEVLKASDLRTRDPTKARILYLDQLIPNQHMGQGFGRAFDNLSMLSNLGHRVTVMSLEMPTEEWCDAICLDETRRLGIEVVATIPWEEFTKARVGFYDIVLVSRPSTFERSYKILRKFYKQSPFVVVYDCEALWYRRDIDLLNLYKEGIQFPSIGQVHENYIPVKELMTSIEKTSEETILKLADIIVPVSEKEADIIADLIPGGNIQAIGHVMNLPDRKRVPFQNRTGILFLASFNNDMYYNGDAIWYFLKETYPLVLRDSSAEQQPIRLSIAGRDIPEELRNFTRDNGLDDHVTFFESLEDTTPLFDNARVFIAPHLYGSGIQFKVSQLFWFVGSGFCPKFVLSRCNHSRLMF